MALLTEIFSHKWLIIITVIAVIGGNLALLKATANMKMPKGRSYPPPQTGYDDDDENDDKNDDWGQVNKNKASDTSDTSLIKNATATQQTKIGRKEDHNRNNGPQ